MCVNGPENAGFGMVIKLERNLASVGVGETVQFERLGYFCADPDSTAERPVFNRTVGLKDAWAKAKGQG